MRATFSRFNFLCLYFAPPSGKTFNDNSTKRNPLSALRATLPEGESSLSALRDTLPEGESLLSALRDTLPEGESSPSALHTTFLKRKLHTPIKKK